MIKEIKTMYFRIGTNIRKCSIWPLNAEPLTRSVWKDELPAALGFSSLLFNFTVLDLELCEIKIC
jgi:hypothetical protein